MPHKPVGVLLEKDIQLIQCLNLKMCFDSVPYQSLPKKLHGCCGEKEWFSYG